ncbi:unnamed protein product [Symbiodinium sp. CCMP2592]|nr:unnamed protein product [Symbiodinium sp. CCMP2592]
MPACEVMPQEDGAAQADADGMKDMSQKMPTLGNRIMVLKEGWVALILSGTKTMELRSQPAKTGPIWIGFEGRVYAHAEISDCRQMSQEIYEETRAQHRHMGRMKQGDSLYGLVLTNLVQLAHPIDYYQKPATVLWENFRTGPNEKLPHRRASKRAQEMRALQDAREDDETSEIDESPGCKNTEEEDRRGKDGGDATRPSTEREPQELGCDYTLQEEVRQFVRAVMYRELEQEQLAWWQDSLKERCRYHRFPCRTWFELVYTWRPAIHAPEPRPNEKAERPQPQEVLAESFSHPRGPQPQHAPTYSIPCYIPVLLSYEHNGSSAQKPGTHIHRV